MANVWYKIFFDRLFHEFVKDVSDNIKTLFFHKFHHWYYFYYYIYTNAFKIKKTPEQENREKNNIKIRKEEKNKIGSKQSM